MRKETFVDLKYPFIATLVIFGATWALAMFSKGCRAGDKEDKIIALTDSIEKKLDERDSTLRKTYEVLADGFRNDKYYDENGNEYVIKPCYDENGDRIGTPQEIAAKCFDYLKEHVETDCYSELEEIRDLINE